MKSRSAVVLDTTAYSRLRTGHGKLLDRLSRATIVHVPVVVLGELEAGFRRGSRYAENRRVLEEMLDETFVSVLDVDAGVARRYGMVLAHLRERGRPIPTNDVWIAATTIQAGGHLLTFDSDFEHVEGLEHTLLR